jgi:phage/plasmid-like protein (TIGR03299 family)
VPEYLLLSNTHTGQGSVVVKFTAIRVVCQNTLMLALQDGQPEFRVRHTSLMRDRLRAISDLIAIAKDVYAEAHAVFQRMARTDLGRGLFDRYLEVVFPQTTAQKAKAVEPPKRDHVRRTLDEAPNLNIPRVRGTLWAAFNAVTQFEDYRHSAGESPEGRLNRVWFGAGAGLKLRAFQAAKELAMPA